MANLQNVETNSTDEATNRLSISAPASLSSHEWAGHQIKVNKASTADTASLLFQTNWSGHAEMGLNGLNSWLLEISYGGSSRQEAISFDSASGSVSAGAVSNVAKLWVSAVQATTSVSSAVAFVHVSATGGSFQLTSIGRCF